jgi:hypothetical protein
MKASLILALVAIPILASCSKSSEKRYDVDVRPPQCMDDRYLPECGDNREVLPDLVK